MSLVDVRPPGRTPYVIVTPLGGEMFSQGLAPEAIAGTYRGVTRVDNAAPPRREDFVQSPTFTTFLHTVIARYAPELAEYTADAARLGDGWVYVVDRRPPSESAVAASRDVLGAFAVHRGAIVPGSYHPNEDYALLTEDGFVSLHETLRTKLLSELLVANSRYQSRP